MVDATQACKNRLLAALPPEIFERWLPQLEPMQMNLGASAYEAGQMMSHVYFPTTALVSQLHDLDDGPTAEIAIVGNDGIVGISLFMGGFTTSTRGVVQGGGRALRLPTTFLQSELEGAGPSCTSLSAVRASLDQPHDADRCLQSSPQHRTAVVPLAPAES